MINFLRKLPTDLKRKLVALVAGGVTLCILVLWFMYSMGTLNQTIESTKAQGSSVFNFLDQNVEIAYNAFTEVKDRVFVATTTATSTGPIVNATSTYAFTATSTTE